LTEGIPFAGAGGDRARSPPAPAKPGNAPGRIFHSGRERIRFARIASFALTCFLIFGLQNCHFS
jgi:hypothetical protein